MNAALTYLVNEVTAITNRPDLVNETILAVRAATLKAHKQDFFAKDIFETGISFSTSDYLQSLDYKTLLPRWRALKYLRKYDAVGQTAGKELDVIVPEKVLDGYGVERTDVIYLAGQVYQIKSSTSEQYFLLGCYLNPDITTDNFSSWIATEHEFAVVYEAISQVFKTIEYDSASQQYAQLAMDARQQVVNENVCLTGY